MLEIARGMVRPLVTVLLVVAVLVFLPFKIDVPERLWDLVFMVLGFWFGSRTLKGK